MRKAFLLILSIAMLIYPMSSYAAEAPLGASELAKIAGLDITETLVIGKKEDVQNGKVPLAHTIPETYAILEKPHNVPRYPQQARQKTEFEEFDSGLIKAYTGFDELYSAMFKLDQRDRVSLPLRPVYVSPEDIEAAMKKKKPARKVQAARPRKRP